MEPIEQSAFFRASAEWERTYPGAHVGVLVLRAVANPPHSQALEERKQELDIELRRRFAGQDRKALREHPTLRAYADYYGRFDKTYHVQLQLESIVHKGRSIPTSAALVEAMFMAELDDLLLTAGHDLDAVRPPILLGVARGTEQYVLLQGEGQSPKAGDMTISDSQGIISSIVYGPDQRTQLKASTCNALFTTYAPTGIGPSAVETHLKKIAGYAQLAAPAARIDLLTLCGGD